MVRSILLSMLFVFSFFSINAQNRQWSCGDELVDNRDGKSYQTVLIGNQCWMAENLNYGTMIQSTKAGGQMTNNGSVEKYCWDNVEANCDGSGGAIKLGAFYEWSEAVQDYNLQPALHVQGVCPDGWHIPSRNEFNQLMSDLGGFSIAGDKMKEGGSSGFEGILTGYRCTMSGSFRKSALGTTWSAYYWGSEQSDNTNAYFYELNETNSIFNTCAYSPFTKSLGNSIRCIENTSSSIKENKEIGLEINNLYLTDGSLLRININSSQPTKLIISILDINAKLIEIHSFESNNTNALIEIALDQRLARGIYFVKLKNGSAQIIEKFIKN